MPVGRRDIKANLGAGNFGSAGTPLGLTPPKKGPDFGRLLGALGVAAGAAKESGKSKDNDDVRAAQTAVREIYLKEAQAGEGKEAFRERQRREILAIKDKYASNAPAFIKAFTNENPAVKAVDELNARLRIQTFQNTTEQLDQDNPGWSSVTRSKELDKRFEAEAAIMKAHGTDAHQEFLEKITGWTLERKSLYTKDGLKKIKAENNQANFNTHTLEAVAAIESLGERSVEQSRDSIDGFNAFHTNINNNQEEVLSDIKGLAISTYNKHLALNGEDDRVGAGAKTAELLVSLATKYNRPELLDIGDKAFDSSGVTLRQFHGAMFDDAKASISNNRDRLEEQLEDRQIQDLHNQEVKRIDDFSSDILTSVNSALVPDVDTKDVFGTFRKLTESEEQANKDAKDGKISGKELRTKLNILKTSRGLLVDGKGDPEAEAQLQMILKDASVSGGRIDIEKFNSISHLLSKKSTAIFKSPLFKEIDTRRYETAAARADEKAQNIQRATAKERDATRRFKQLASHSQYQRTLDTMTGAAAADPDIEVPNLDPAILIGKVAEAKWELTSARRKEAVEKGIQYIAPTQEEYAEKTEAIYKEWDTQYEKMKHRVITGREQEVKNLRDSYMKAKPEATEDEVSSTIGAVEALRSNAVFSSRQISPQQVRLIENAIKSKSFEPKDQDVKTLSIAKLKNSQYPTGSSSVPSVSKALNVVFKDTNFDLVGNERDRKNLAEILSKGLRDRVLKRSIPGFPDSLQFGDSMGKVLARYINGAIISEKSGQEPVRAYLWEKAGADSFFKHYGEYLAKDERVELESLFNVMLRKIDERDTEKDDKK